MQILRSVQQIPKFYL